MTPRNILSPFRTIQIQTYSVIVFTSEESEPKVHLLMVFMPPKDDPEPCFAPSANDVVLGLPLMVYSSGLYL